MSAKYIYEVYKNGCAKPRKLVVAKETAKTYVASSAENDVWPSTTIRKATMSNNYSCFYLDEESADKFYAQLHQPPEKEKTADEMFRELGYERDWPNEPQNVILYTDKIQDCEIFLSNSYVEKNIKVCGTWESMNLSYNEILACAKMIEEMGL